MYTCHIVLRAIYCVLVYLILDTGIQYRCHATMDLRHKITRPSHHDDSQQNTSQDRHHVSYQATVHQHPTAGSVGPSGSNKRTLPRTQNKLGRARVEDGPFQEEEDDEDLEDPDDEQHELPEDERRTQQPGTVPVFTPEELL